MMMHPLTCFRRGIIIIFPPLFIGFSYSRGSLCATMPMNMFVQANVLFQWLVIIRGNSCWTGRPDIAVRQQILNRVPSLHASSILETLAIKLDHRGHRLCVCDWKENFRHRQYFKPGNVVQLYPPCITCYWDIFTNSRLIRGSWGCQCLQSLI
jgi:hypothetical protein